MSFWYLWKYDYLIISSWRFSGIDVDSPTKKMIATLYFHAKNLIYRDVVATIGNNDIDFDAT